jgi:hypothetical protein
LGSESRRSDAGFGKMPLIFPAAAMVTSLARPHQAGLTFATEDYPLLRADGFDFMSVYLDKCDIGLY